MPNPLVRKEHVGGAASATLTASMSPSDLSFNISTNTGWPTGGVGSFYVVIDPATSNEEKVLCASQSTFVVTVAGGGRGADGTTAKSHAIGAVAYPCWAAAEADELNAHGAAIAGVHGAIGGIVGTTDTQTLTNKSMSGANNTFTNIPKASVVGAPAGAVVGTTDAQTLTNKTMSGGANTFSAIPQSAVTSLVTDLARIETVPALAVFTASGSFAAVSGALAYRIRGVSGGGAGGGAAATGAGQSAMGGGGQGGHAFEVIVPAAGLTFPLAVTIPAAAAGSAGANGANGGTLTVVQNAGAGATLISLTGGGGGPLGPAAATVGFATSGGIAAVVSTMPANAFVVPGMPGSIGERMSATACYGGDGGSSGMGGGGNWASGGGGAGNAGVGYGGGGSGGAIAASAAAVAGGAGVAGIVIFEAIF